MPKILDRKIYFENKFFKFSNRYTTLYQHIVDFEEIRLSNNIISMKGTNGKVDNLIGYKWTENQLKQLKSFINRKAPHIKVLILE